MNNNVENQNLNIGNTGITSGVVGPTPVSPVMPNQMEGIAPTQAPIAGPETIVAPQPTPVPQVQQSTQVPNVGTIPEGNVGLNVPMDQQMPSSPNQEPTNISPIGGMNLAPEGVVAPQTLESTPVVPPVVEPLMSSTLTDQTVLNLQQPMNNGQVVGGLEPSVPPMGMTPPPMTDNMGMMGGIPAPPQLPPEDNKKAKKKINPTLILLVVVLIAVVGGAVYYFLFMGKSKTSGIVIAPLNNEIEAGTEMILDSAASYVRVTGMNVSECKVESNLDTDKVGTYEYTVTCGTKVSGPNKITVKDTIAPVVETKDVVLPLNTTPFPEDFIENIEDASECTYEFASAVDQIDTSKAGTYDITIAVSDAYENVTEKTAKLIIDENAPVEYLYCEGEGESSQNYKTAKVFNTYKYGIGSTGNIYNMKKIITYTFANEEDYLSALEDIKEKQFDDMEGAIKKEPTRFTISFTQETDEATLSKDFNLTPFPKTSTEMEEYHLSVDEMCYTDIE